MHSDWASSEVTCPTWANHCATGCDMCSLIGQSPCRLGREARTALIQTPLIQTKMAPHYKSEWCSQKRRKLCQADRHKWWPCQIHRYYVILKGACDPQNDHLGFLLFFNLKVIHTHCNNYFYRWRKSQVTRKFSLCLWNRGLYTAHCLFFLFLFLFFQGPFTGPSVIFRIVQTLRLYAWTKGPKSMPHPSLSQQRKSKFQETICSHLEGEVITEPVTVCWANAAVFGALVKNSGSLSSTPFTCEIRLSQTVASSLQDGLQWFLPPSESPVFASCTQSPHPWLGLISCLS